MELLGLHTVHKEREHLAPHRVLAVGTCLGTEEDEITEGSEWPSSALSVVPRCSGDQTAWATVEGHRAG
jgi:hypothetical protein